MQKQETDDTTNWEKYILRKQVLRNRNALSEEKRQLWNKQILENLMQYDRRNPCSVYLCYVSYKSEVSTKEFILWCLKNGKTVFVPKVLVNQHIQCAEWKSGAESSGETVENPTEMEFYQITSWEELSAGYQGILEPKVLSDRAFSGWLAKQETVLRSNCCAEKETVKKSEKMTVEKMMPKAEMESKRIHLRMLLPGIVFDKCGNRIGYGGGFYDRWLAKWAQYESNGLAVLQKIGLAYGIQVVDKIPSDYFDKKIDGIITEELYF